MQWKNICDTPNPESLFFFFGIVSMNSISNSAQHNAMLATGQVCRAHVV